MVVSALSVVICASAVYFVLAWVLMQRVQALSRLPSKTAYCKFGNSLLMEARIEWERFMVRL